MSIVKSGKEVFRPYARLVSILGDQLISDKWVAIIELVKNCYDADAENVQVRFIDFDEKGYGTIEIEDDGEGMTDKIIVDKWMKPATPNKLNLKKNKSDRRFTKKGRVMQGDKGVGRFSIYKLGNYIELYSKTKTGNEVKLTLDFKPYADDDFIDNNPNHQDKFLDEIENEWVENDKPERITNEKAQGTLIRITQLRNTWKEEDLEKLMSFFNRMEPAVLPNNNVIKPDFEIKTFWNNSNKDGDVQTISDIIDIAPFLFKGNISNIGELSFIYKYYQKEISRKFNIFDEKIRKEFDFNGFKPFKDAFLKEFKDENGEKKISIIQPNVGNFEFVFYAFDLTDKSPTISKDLYDKIRDVSVYLYRDGIRVYPYGEIGDDWLDISKFRSEDKAGKYFSYNDLIGFIFITLFDNPKLKDSTNREGLINIDGIKNQFIALIQTCLKVFKNISDIDKKLKKLEKEKPIRTAKEDVKKNFDVLQKAAQKSNDKVVLAATQKLLSSVNYLVETTEIKKETAENLAGTGMIVEKTTHDVIALALRLRQNADDLIDKYHKGIINTLFLKDFLTEIRDGLELIYQELSSLSPLFINARKVIKNVSILEYLEKNQQYLRKDIEKNKIKFEIQCPEDIIVKTNTGLILQTFLNLTDNAIYWLKQESGKERKIKVVIDNKHKRIIFADNGIGISDDRKDIVFEEFYSTKAHGRGLGLYIVRELLERINAKIYVETDESKKILEGANFVIQL